MQQRSHDHDEHGHGGEARHQREKRVQDYQGFSRLLGRGAHLAAFDAGKKCARQPRLAGMALAMHRAEIEKLIAERVALFLLSEDALQSERQFAQTRCFRPASVSLFAHR